MNTTVANQNLLNKCDSTADAFVQFFSSKFFLVLMTLAIAFCSSSFAFGFGKDFDYKYGVMFSIALVALTFHYSKYIHPKILKGFRFWTIKGLIILTVFVSAGAWLSSATKKSDPTFASLLEEIENLESQIATKSSQIGGYILTGNPQNAIRVQREQSELQIALNQKLSEKTEMSKNFGLYKSGAFAIFGHFQVILGLSQEAINMIFMIYILSVLITLEITMGAAATRKK